MTRKKILPPKPVTPPSETKIAEFNAWLDHALPGERFEYHRGLNLDGVPALARIALKASIGQQVILMQARHGRYDFGYIAIMTSPACPAKIFPRAECTAAKIRSGVFVKRRKAIAA